MEVPERAHLFFLSSCMYFRCINQNLINMQGHHSAVCGTEYMNTIKGGTNYLKEYCSVSGSPTQLYINPHVSVKVNDILHQPINCPFITVSNKMRNFLFQIGYCDCHVGLYWMMKAWKTPSKKLFFPMYFKTINVFLMCTCFLVLLPYNANTNILIKVLYMECFA